MLDYSDAILNSEAYTCLQNDIKLSRISHAYLFSSQDFNFLLKFSEKIAAMLILNSEEEKNQQNIETRVEKHIHPDVYFVGFDEKLNVETAKKVVADAYVRPFEASVKVFVINGEDLAEASQNKLLKIIEEPPERTYFLIISKNSKKLLPTILSRVKEVELGEIHHNDIVKMLMVTGINDADAEIYAGCSNGNAEFAEKLAGEDGFLQLFEDILDCLKNLNGSKDVLKYAEKFTKKDIDLNEFFEIFLLVLRDVLMVNSGASNLVQLKNAKEKMEKISESFTENALAQLIFCCGEAEKEIFFNVNGVEIMDKFLFKIAEVKVKCRKLLG